MGGDARHATMFEANFVGARHPSRVFLWVRDRGESGTRGDMAFTGRAGTPEQGNFWRSSGRAGFDIVPTMPNQQRCTLRTMSNRATLAATRSGAALPAPKQAAGVPSAWSQPSPFPPRDHADGAPLGRLRRTRRPAPRVRAPEPRPSTPVAPPRTASPDPRAGPGCRRSGPPGARRGGARGSAPAARCCRPWCEGCP